MALQTLFRTFDETMKLRRFDENAELREKRDRVLKRLRENMSMTFDWFNQGSYAMGTGVKPLNSDYDIDIGIVLNIDQRIHDPVTVKGWIHKAVEEHTARVEWRRSCITVYYQQGGQPVYHIDLAVLAKDPYSGVLHLAIGKEHSAKDQRFWQQDDRQGFASLVDNRFAGEDAAQFRRVIRCLKRWKDVQFASEGRAAPTGLGLTVAAYQWFTPTKPKLFETTIIYDDLAAMMALVQTMIGQFAPKWDASTNTNIQRLLLKFPCAPWDDVFARMTNQQMQELYNGLKKLSEYLNQALRTGDTTPLRKAFGTDFPVK